MPSSWNSFMEKALSLIKRCSEMGYGAISRLGRLETGESCSSGEHSREATLSQKLLLRGSALTSIRSGGHGRHSLFPLYTRHFHTTQGCPQQWTDPHHCPLWRTVKRVKNSCPTRGNKLGTALRQPRYCFDELHGRRPWMRTDFPDVAVAQVLW